jgi:hypothetical protein
LPFFSDIFINDYSTLILKPPILFVQRLTAIYTSPACCPALIFISTSQFLISEITTGSIEMFVEFEINIIGCLRTPL